MIGMIGFDVIDQIIVMTYEFFGKTVVSKTITGC